MPQSLAPVLPMRPRPARTRKPNRRPGSCPASPPDSAVQFAANLVAADRMTATRIARLSRPPGVAVSDTRAGGVPDGTERSEHHRSR